MSKNKKGPRHTTGWVFLLALLCLWPAQATQAASIRVSWDNVTTYTDNTPFPPGTVIEYRVFWSYNNSFAEGTYQEVPPYADNTFTTLDNTLTGLWFDPDALGMQKDSPTFFTAKSYIRDTGASSVFSPEYKWYVGSSGDSGPWDVRLMELPWSTGRGNFAVSFSAPRSPAINPAFYRVYYRANRFDNVQAGAMVYQGSNRSSCFSDGGNIDNGVYVQVVAHAADSSVLGWSEKAFFLPGAIDCQDINNCRADFAHTFSILDPLFGRYLSEFGLSPKPDIPQCGTGSEFIVPVLTIEQLADGNGDGRIGPEDELDRAPRLGNRTVR